MVEGKVHKAPGSLHRNRLVYLAVTCRSRRRRLLFPVRVQTDDSSGNN